MEPSSTFFNFCFFYLLAFIAKSVRVKAGRKSVAWGERIKEADGRRGGDHLKTAEKLQATTSAAACYIEVQTMKWYEPNWSTSKGENSKNAELYQSKSCKYVSKTLRHPQNARNLPSVLIQIIFDQGKRLYTRMTRAHQSRKGLQRRKTLKLTR